MFRTRGRGLFRRQVEFFMPRSQRVDVFLSPSISGLCLAAAMALVCANGLGAQSTGSIFRNVDSSVAYVGSKSCAAAGCHEEISRT